MIICCWFVQVSDGLLGLFLSFGAGNYIYLATMVSLPNAMKKSSDESTDENEIFHEIKVLGSLIIGVLVIGLILIDHEHCGGDHEGHGH